MPEENVPMEKISLSGNDFADNLENNNFGIEDTQLLASTDLQNFLLSSPDEIKKVEDEKKIEEALPPKKEEKKVEEKKIEEKPSGKKALENILFDNEEEEEQQRQNNTSEKITNPEEGSDETYNTLSKDLLRLGVFSKNSEEETEETIDIKTPEDFLERFSLEKKKGAINILDNFLSQFGDDHRKMFDAVFVNGVNPQEYLQSFTKIEAIKDLDLTDEANQERVVKSYYKGLKWDDAKIENRITKLKDYGDLEDEAKSYHEVLLNKEKEVAATLEKQKVEEIQKNKEKDIAAKKSYQRILAEKLKAQDFDGLPITQKDAEETVEYMSEKKYKLANGELLSEYDKDLMELNRPENHELKIKLGLLLRKKLDLTSVKKTTISKKSDALFTLSTKNAKQPSKEKEIKSFF
jgi:phosphoglycolate phosphatase-like HAD superfamily hydrolase